jgi:hypothetical protein
VAAESGVEHGNNEASFLFHWSVPVEVWREYPPHSPSG